MNGGALANPGTPCFSAAAPASSATPTTIIPVTLKPHPREPRAGACSREGGVLRGGGASAA